ncbi:pF317L [African swine fever virus Benin 97/1]|uniref:PF317L n=1 Tax=African swine fever virus (isolate Pig/Benin/Ben 97-1/1997) TaxID=443876 RepID=A9JKY4_ASFPB|nr:pF317L [African swine fever virus Benin 97/1]WNK21980.1 pF317L [African swine fever virus]CAN10142.1 pF317L [African swine fever virus Benin 97/1]
MVETQMDKLGFLLNHIGKQVTTKVLSNAHITQTMKEIILENHGVDGGAAKNVSKGKSSPKEKKHWTEFESWEQLSKSKRSFKEYWAERNEIVNTLLLNWDNVRGAIKKFLDDDREWCGRINMINGVPEIVEIIPSPYRAGENVYFGSEAMMPADIYSRVANKPAMFVFHTHPNLGSCCGGMPSICDISTTLRYLLMGWTAGHLIISSNQVGMLTVDKRIIVDLWANENPRWLMAQKILDIFMMLTSRRSLVNPWTLRDLKKILQDYGIEYIIFPSNDFFIYEDERLLMFSKKWTNFFTLHELLDDLETIETKASSTT